MANEINNNTKVTGGPLTQLDTPADGGTTAETPGQKPAPGTPPGDGFQVGGTPARAPSVPARANDPRPPAPARRAPKGKLPQGVHTRSSTPRTVDPSPGRTPEVVDMTAQVRAEPRIKAVRDKRLEKIADLLYRSESWGPKYQEKSPVDVAAAQAEPDTAESVRRMYAAQYPHAAPLSNADVNHIISTAVDQINIDHHPADDALQSISTAVGAGGQGLVQLPGETVTGTLERVALQNGIDPRSPQVRTAISLARRFEQSSQRSGEPFRLTRDGFRRAHSHMSAHERAAVARENEKLRKLVFVDADLSETTGAARERSEPDLTPDRRAIDTAVAGTRRSDQEQLEALQHEQRRAERARVSADLSEHELRHDLAKASERVREAQQQETPPEGGPPRPARPTTGK